MEVVDYEAKKAMEAVIVAAIRAANPNLVAGAHFSDCVVAAKNIRRNSRLLFPNCGNAMPLL